MGSNNTNNSTTIKATDLLTDKMKALIAEYSAISKLNHFLYKHEDCHRLIYGLINRIELISRCSSIEKKLINDVHNIFHGRRVRVYNIKGFIKHSLTRTFENKILENNVSFRSIISGDPLSGETIALWIETDDRHTTHLYNIDVIEMIE